MLTLASKNGLEKSFSPLTLEQSLLEVMQPEEVTYIQAVKIYPNPVSPNFSGLVIMEGLVNNALIKITDASGKLVNELNANGSTATWNTRRVDGTRVNLEFILFLVAIGMDLRPILVK